MKNEINDNLQNNDMSSCQQLTAQNDN